MGHAWNIQEKKVIWLQVIIEENALETFIFFRYTWKAVKTDEILKRVFLPLVP